MRSGAKIVTAQFLDVSKNEVSLKSLVPVGEDLDWNIEIQVLDNGGRTIEDQDYMWVDGDGWCTPDGDPITEDIKFAPGQGLCLYGSLDEDQGLQSAGAVGTLDVVVALRDGGIACGNPFPIAVDLNDILPQGDEIDWTVEIQMLDNGGSTIDSQDYMWVDGDGWCTPDGDPITEKVTFAPGQGFWVYGSSEDQSLRFAAPEL